MINNNLTLNKSAIILFIIIHSTSFLNSQNYSIRTDSVGNFILCKDNIDLDTFINGPGQVTQYIVFDENNFCLINEIQGGIITEYINIKIRDGSMKITDSNVRWMESQSWPYKKITYILLGEDKVEKYENGVSIGLVDFSKIIERNVKRKKEMQEYMKRYEELKKNKK